VFQQPEPSGVGADVAPDLALTLGAEVQRDGHALDVELVLEGFEDASSFAHDGPRGGIHGCTNHDVSI
jgi:hypothetical protein